MIAATMPSHDPLPPFTIGYAMARIDEAAPRSTMEPYVRGNARDFLLRNSGYARCKGSGRGCDDWNIFLRAPYVEFRSAKSLNLRWWYDGHELVLRFDWLCESGAILDGRRVSEEEAVEAIIEWNQHVIRGEARRLRERSEAALLDEPVPACEPSDVEDIDE